MVISLQNWLSKVMSEKSEKYKIKNFQSKLSQAINKYQLIDKDDRVLVGVSGGKDSMSLLSGLAKRAKYKGQAFTIIAVHIDITNVPYSIDLDYIRRFCAKNNINFIVEKLEVDFEQNTGKPQCFVCSWHRRKRTFELSKELNCNKIAFGHHMDDAIETLLINMCYHNSISSLPASLNMFDGRVKLIRPMILLTDKEIKEFANTENFPSEKTICPWSDKTKRNQASEIVDEIEKRFKYARHGMFKSMSKIHLDYLPTEPDNDPLIHGLNLPKRNKKN